MEIELLEEGLQPHLNMFVSPPKQIRHKSVRHFQRCSILELNLQTLKVARNTLTCICLYLHHRIHKNMLMDLSKDIMMDLGITVIGDIIAILRHAKQVYRQVGSVILYVHIFISNSEWLILIGHDLCFRRTCAKWQRKPFPQDRPALKPSLEEPPTLVSVYASDF